MDSDEAIGVGQTVSAVPVSELPELDTLHKPKKVALVACMNKRLNYLNNLVRIQNEA